MERAEKRGVYRAKKEVKIMKARKFWILTPSFLTGFEGYDILRLQIRLPDTFVADLSESTQTVFGTPSESLSAHKADGFF